MACRWQTQERLSEDKIVTKTWVAERRARGRKKRGRKEGQVGAPQGLDFQSFLRHLVGKWCLNEWMAPPLSSTIHIVWRPACV